MSAQSIQDELIKLGPWYGEDCTNVRHIKSAIRTLEVFELFALHQRPLTVGEVSRALSIPQPSVSMLLKNLSSLGYLEHSRQTRTFVPTVRIMLLGTWIQRRLHADQNLDHLLKRLQGAVGETVTIAIQNDCYAQYVYAQMASDPDRMEVQSGLMRPLTCTAVGRALLCGKPRREVELLARRCNAAMAGTRHKVNIPWLLDLLDEVEEKGFAWTHGDMTQGYSAIAVALPCPIGTMPVAVGVGGPSSRMEQKGVAIVEALFEVKSALLSAQNVCALSDSADEVVS